MQNIHPIFISPSIKLAEFQYRQYFKRKSIYGPGFEFLHCQKGKMSKIKTSANKNLSTVHFLCQMKFAVVIQAKLKYFLIAILFLVHEKLKY